MKHLDSNIAIATFLGGKIQSSYAINDEPKGLYWSGETALKYRKDIMDISVGEFILVDALQFHKSLDWLLPVIYKIHSLGYSTLMQDDSFYCSKIKLDYFDTNISTDDGNFIKKDMYDIAHYSGTLLENVYNGIVEFANWHNTNNNEN